MRPSVIVLIVVCAVLLAATIVLYILGKRSEKKQKEQIIADTQAICTEMEGSAIAHAAWRNGIPFVIIRAISDKADDSAEMDFPTFEAMAAKRCAQVTAEFAKKLL